ncbi:MAG: TraM recognition domain-containing protein [Minisyncoccia bacterium]
MATEVFSNYNNSPEKKFTSPQEELEFLRREVVRKEKALSERGLSVEKEKIIEQGLETHSSQPADSLLHEKYSIPAPEVESIVLNLSPETHDKQMEELIHVLRNKGVRNTISVIEKMNNPHLMDDFHRFLIQYVKAGFHDINIKEADPLMKSLKMALFEISLPEINDEEDKGKRVSEVISAMEHFYSGMLSVFGNSEKNTDYFALELANPAESNELLFYASVPRNKADLFEKQVIAIFPEATITEQPNDYNIFSAGSFYQASYATLDKDPIFPLRTFESFDHDTLSVLLNVFSKIDKTNEGASLQIIFKPCGTTYNDRYQKTIEDIAKGRKLKEAMKQDSSVGRIFGEALVNIYKDFSGEKKEEKNEPVDEKILEQIRAKAGSRVVKTNVRLVVSANSKERSKEVMLDLQSSFNQFENPLGGNRFKFNNIVDKYFNDFFEEFSFRDFSEKQVALLNLKELTSILHFPNLSGSNTPFLKQAKAAGAAAPLDMPASGVLLGINKFRGVEKKIYFTKEDRLRHFYSIGQTGTGKTTLLKNMITQDILNGEGVCFIDPHGSDIQDLLAVIPPNRYEDVIYFDPGYTERPMALNMLEYDLRFPEQKTFVVNEMMSIFNKLFDMKTAGGPMFEQYFRNAAMLVIEDPETGNTLLDISRVLSDARFRELKLSHCHNPIVVQFWREIATKAGGEASLANIVPYITSKFDVFLSNEIMRPIVSQEKSSLNFRKIMDEKKILLVNLSKGRLGEINSSLIGLIIVGKIQMAAMSRVDSFGKDLPPFYLYIDEFQNVTTDSISQILSEARKYKLSLNIANQYIKQLDEKIRDAVFGNVGSIAAFRIGADDAEYMEKQFLPVFTAKDIMNIDNRNAYLKLLVNGRPVKPFNIETLAPSKGNTDIAEKIKQLSYLKYGENKLDIEASIMKKYQKF